MKHTAITSVKENQDPHFVLGKLYYKLDNRATDGRVRLSFIAVLCKPHEGRGLGKDVYQFILYLTPDLRSGKFVKKARDGFAGSHTRRQRK